MAYSPIADTMKKMQVTMNWSRQVSMPLDGVPLKRLMQTRSSMTSSDILPGTIWRERERESYGENIPVKLNPCIKYYKVI